VKFVVDANLPRRLAKWLECNGHEPIYAGDLRSGADTRDSEIIAFENNEKRIVITRDSDFVRPFQTRRGPPGLVLIGIGNCTNAELLEHLERFKSQLFSVIELGKIVEVRREMLLVAH
jgi:predicted nuclease of predicted toxin-antitoxin system